MFQVEDTFTPPFYTDLYNFLDSAQNDIFQNSYVGSIPTAGSNQTVLTVLAQNLSDGFNSISSPAPSSTSPTSPSLAFGSSSPVPVFKQ